MSWRLGGSTNMAQEKLYTIKFEIRLLKTNERLGEQTLEETNVKQFFEILEKFDQDVKDFFRDELKLTLDNISTGVLICRVDEFNLEDFIDLNKRGVANNAIKSFLKELVGCSVSFDFKLDINCILSDDCLKATKSPASIQAFQGIADVHGSVSPSQAIGGSGQTFQGHRRSSSGPMKGKELAPLLDSEKYGSQRPKMYSEAVALSEIVSTSVLLHLYQEKDNSSRNEPRSFNDDAFRAWFCLFIPEHAGTAKKVWLIVKDDLDIFPMNNNVEQKSFWTTDRMVSRSKQYHYTVQFKDSLPVRFFKAIFFMQKGNRIEEVFWRPLLEHFKQKDILSGECESKDISVAYKYFFKQMLDDIHPSDLLRHHIEDFERKHWFVLRGGCAHELAYLLFECFAADKKHTFEKAAFVVYVFSKLFADARSIPFLQVRIDQAKIADLLQNLRCHRLELPDKVMEDKAAFVIIALAEKCVGSSCSLCHLVSYCYPTLSSSKILEHKDRCKPSDFVSDKAVISAVENLCNVVDEREAFVELLLEILRTASLKALKQVLTNLKEKLPQDLLKYLTGQMVSVLKCNIVNCTSCDELYNIYETVDDFDQKLLVELAEEFEEMILVRFSKSCLNKDQGLHFRRLIRSADLFQGQDNSKRLILMVVTSKELELHSVFPEILTDNKYLSVLKSQPMLTLITTWINSAKSISDKFGFDHNWYERIQKITESYILARDKELLFETEKMIHDYFSNGAKNWATSCKHVACLIQNTELTRADSTEKVVFDAISPDLERTVIELAKTNDIWRFAEDADALVSVVRSHLLFTERENAIKVLEAIAISKAIRVHEKLVEIMHGERFWRELKEKDLFDIFQLWFETAKNIHCKNKAASQRQNSILCLYEYLGMFLSLSVPSEHDSLKDKLEMNIKKELAILPVETKLDLVKSANPETLKLLQKHIDDMENGMLTRKDLEIYLRSYGDRNIFQFTEWSSDYIIVKMVLSSVHKDFEGFRSDKEKVEFILKYSSFWLNLVTGKNDSGFEMHKTVHAVKDLLNNLTEKINGSTITLHEYNDIKSLISDTLFKLIEHVAGKRGLKKKWQTLTTILENAQQNHRQLKSLHAKLCEMGECVTITDINTIGKELREIKDKLDQRSSSRIGDMDQSGFYKSLAELIVYADSLYPLRKFEGFDALCKKRANGIFESKKRFLESTDNEVDCTLLLGEDSASCDSNSITCVDVARYLDEECVKKYKVWLKQATDETSTLESMWKYGNCEEIKDASRWCRLNVSDQVFVTADWLRDREQHWRKVTSIQKTARFLGFAMTPSNLDHAINMLSECLKNPGKVTIADISKVMKQLQKFLAETDDELWDVFQELSMAKNLVIFLKEFLEDDFRNLIDAVEEQSEQTLDVSSVSDLIKVKQFLQPVLRKKLKNPEELFDTVKNAIQKEGRDFSKRINNCRSHLHGLKALYQHVADRGEHAKATIASAMAKGTFLLSLSDGNVCTAAVNYKKANSGKICIRSDDLNDLRSRALLLSNNEKREEEKQKPVDLHGFIDTVDTMNEVCLTVSELHQLGHFSFKTYQGVFKPNSRQSEMSQELKNLKTELKNWKVVLNDSRQKHLSLNYLYSDQLSLISNFLSGNCDSRDEVQNLLNFIQPGALLDDLRQKQFLSISKDTPNVQQKLNSVGLALDEVMQRTSLVRRQFSSDKKFKDLSKDVSAVVQPGTLYIAHFETESDQTIPILLSLYANTKGYFPVPSEVLFCHKGTSWEEIQLIIQRSILSAEANEVCELHCICNVELLPSSLQSQLVDYLGDVLQNCSSNYFLVIVCQGGLHHPVVDHFSSCVHRLQGLDCALLQMSLQNTWPNVVMVTSSVPGLGKTEYIQGWASERCQRVKTVHISGPVSRDLLVTRLQELKIRQGDLLHLDIGEVDNPNFLDACLFEYIILGCLCSETKIVCCPTSHVAIEVANTVKNRLKDALVILSNFKCIHIKWQNYENFIVSNELCSQVQVVCSYLKSCDDGTLDCKDIILTGLHKVKPLPEAICRQLLATHFSTTADISFNVVGIFLNVLGDQLRKLSNCHFFRVRSLKAMLGEAETIDVKSRLVKALLEVAKEFASRSVQSCRDIQHFAQVGAIAIQHSEENVSKSVVQKLSQAELMAKRVESMLHWADTNHLLVTFNGTDCQTVSALYRDLRQVPAYIKELFKSQLRKDLPNISSLLQDELQVILSRVAGSTMQKGTHKGSDAIYALTPDNLLKMVLVLLRIRSKVPVVIMGETGCGKTSLIRFLAQTCGSAFRHFSIHAGITAEMIRNVVSDSNNVCLEKPKAQVWLFVDEINTCEHLGLLSEVICRQSCFGVPLAKNLVILAACNPYRLREERSIMTAGLDSKVKMDDFSRLVYRVHPLPETMIDYIWDYGTLHKDDEKSYIEQMVKKIFPEALQKWRLQEKVVNLLICSQEFTRSAEGSEWCVSLRDVYRCQMLMTQFREMLCIKLDHFEDKHPKPAYKKNDEKMYHCAIVLALAHCYQSRLADNEKRKQYWKLCSKVMFGLEHKYAELVDMVRFEQKDLLGRMELPQGIAMNTALCENVFVILVCIINRLPIFLVGKPGCSKSLSIQLIKSNLRGKDASDSYFQTLPNLYIVSYQGSESSTSEGIEKVFMKAEKYREHNKGDDVLPVVLLDEVGLAEASRFNPLKVLHGLLEPATGELPKVAVVGISNWCLDAAKMNRAIHLSRPDMDVQELIETGKAISEAQTSSGTDSFLQTNVSKTRSRSQLRKDKILEALAKVYDKYQKKQRFKNFHGLRDYYALIKYVSRNMCNKKNCSDDDEVNEIDVVMKGFQRNFGGLEGGSHEISQLFLSSMKEKSDVMWSVEEIITENLQDMLARHLMLITSGDSALGILIRCLEKLARKYVVMFGSKFKEDQTEEYSYRILNRIILCMETGNILILKDLDAIYGSLYDMLNQNYTIVGKKKNCRIALGPHSNPMCQVHDDFRCIVLVDQEKVDFSDPPFLNRFEKQVFRFDDIIDENQKALINDLEEWAHDVSHISDQPAFGKQDAFLGMNVDTISSVVYQITREQKNLNYSETFAECQNAILWLVPPDAMLRVSDSDLSRKRFTEIKNIQLSYFERPIHKGLSHFLTLLEEKSSDNIPPAFSKTPGIRLVICTHSNIYVDVRKALEKHEPLQIEKLGTFKSEKQFTSHMRQFFESENGLLIVQCEPSEDGQHLPLAKFQLEELHREYATKTCKNICIILHISRSSASLSSQWQFSFLSGWQLVVIDSLEEQENFPLTKTLGMTVADLLQTDFRPIKDCIRENLVWAFACTSSSYRERSIEEFSHLIVQITKSDSLVFCLAECLLKHIQKEHKESTDYIDITNPTRWQVKVAFNSRLLRSATSFTDALKQYLTECVITPLANLVHQLEELSAWHSYFSEETTEIWVGMFNTPDVFNLRNVQVPQGPGSFKIDHKPLKLQYPFSQVFIEKCLKHEVFFKEELSAEMASSSIDQLNVEMFDRYNKLFEQDLETVIKARNWEIHESKFISDICSYLSMAYGLDEQDRVEIALWLISFKAPSCDQTQQMNRLAASLLCLWQHESLFHSLLQLFSECQTLLPCSIKELLTTISDRKQRSDSLIDATHTEINSSNSFLGEQGSVDMESTNNVEDDILLEQTDEGLVQLFSSMEVDVGREDTVTSPDDRSNTNQESVLHCNTIVLREIGTSGKAMSDNSDGFKQSDIQTADQSHDEIKQVSKIYKSESENSMDTVIGSGRTSEAKVITEDNSQNRIALIGLEDEEFLALHPEERLVHLMCRLLIPTKSVLECHGVSGWHGSVCSVLSFCSSVSSYPVSLHALRIFNDLATILFHCKLESQSIGEFLMQLADGVDLENLENSLDSMQMFAKIVKLSVNLEYENVPEEEIQSFMTLCIGRIMYINPETALLRAFLEKAARLDLIDKNLSHLQPLLHRVFLEADEPEKLFECFAAHVREEDNESVEQYMQMVAIGSALAQVDIRNPVFLVLCIDVIQNIVMKMHAWEQLEHVQSTSDCHLITFEASIKVIEQSQDVSLRLAAAVAYVKEFLHLLKEMIVFDLEENSFTDHNLLYQNMHSLFSCSNQVIVEYLLKELKMGRSFGQVRGVLTKLETVIPLLAKVSLPDNDLTLSVGYKLLGQSTEHNFNLEKALMNLDKDDKPVRECLNKKPVHERDILGFFEALLHTAYVPASLRQLTHSEKQIGTWMKEQSLQISSNKLVFLLQQRLTNEESFTVDLFRLLPGSTHLQLQKTAFLLHLVCVLVARAQEQHDGSILFVECLIRPENIQSEKVLSEIFCVESSTNTSVAGSMSLVTCKCWTRVIFLESQCSSCPVCEISWKTDAVKKDRSVEQLDMLTVTETADKEMTGKNILKLMITASLLGSLALDILKPDCTEGSKTSDYKDMLINQFEVTWNALEASLQLNAEDLSLFLQNIIDKMNIFPKNYQFQKDIGGLIAVVVDNFLAPSFYNDIKHYHSCVSTVNEEIKHAVLELPSQHSDKSLDSFRHLFRISKPRTAEDLRSRFYINKKEETHPVLDLFFKKSHSLILLGHLIPLVKWSQLCYQATNHRFTRDECKNLTLSQLSPPEGQKENFKKDYDAFMASWKELWKKENLFVIKRFDSSLPDQPQTGAVVICENAESALYKVLKVLVNIQNMFLEELLAIAQSGKCPSLGFLKKNFTDMAAIKCVLIQNLKENQVIPWNFQDLLETQTKFGQNSPEFGNGNQVCYNFVKIEMEMANSLCLGKAYIIINDTFPFVTYANELFVSCAWVLREFRSIIPQKNLAQSVKEGIENKMKTDPDFAKQMMKQTEILLCLVKKTGGSPDQTLASYVQTWLRNLSSGFQDGVLRPFGHEPMRLSHLVALYEFLENIQADVEIETLHESFKAALPPAAKQELEEFIHKKHFPIKLIQAAFRKFIMRYVRNFDPEQMNPNSPLVDWMAEPTFWPEELEVTGAEDKLKTVKNEFPLILNLEHTFHALECIKAKINEMETKQPKWYKSRPKPDTGSPAAAVSGERLRGRQDRRRTTFDRV